MEIPSFWKLCPGLVYILLSNCLVGKVVCQCDDATRPLMLSSTNLPQYFTSPDYPSNYPPNADCAWYIEAPSEYDKIILNIELFRTQQDEFLNIYDGSNSTGDLLIAVDDTNQKATNAFVSTNHQLYFTFQSDGANEQKGFNILYFSNNSAYQYACGETLSITSFEEQVFMSPNLPNPYSITDACSWYFVSDSPIAFKIKFLDMHACKPEYLSFYDGNNTDTLLAQHCSTAYTYDFDDIKTTTSQAFVEWTLTAPGDNYYGFLLTVGLSNGTTESLGINLTYPMNNETIELILPEDTSIGNVNDSNALIILTYTGDSINLNIDPWYSQTSDEPVSVKDDVQVFAFDGTQPNRYLLLAKKLDYETIDKFSLLVTLDHPDVPAVTYSVTFNITVTDVDDVAPTFDNLPNNYTLSRDQLAGFQIFVVNASDGDGTAENRIITYDIFSGDTDSMFAMDQTSGELTLAKDSVLIPVNVVEYSLNIVAYSGSNLGTFAALTVYVNPDSPPVCTHSIVWADTLDINIVGAGTAITLLDTWTCTDDNTNITYTIESVDPDPTTPVFEINASTGVITLLRSVTSSEVVNRQFHLEIGATDSIGQTEIFSLYMNLTALSCLPNPRNLYVRMDQVLGGAILSNFNCTTTQGLTYSLKQYPQGTFEVNSNAELILKASVVKIKFYSLIVTITDGLDIAVLKFKVIIQTKRCGLNGVTSLNSALRDNMITYITCIFVTSILIRSMLT